jgi:hypothetical protein
MWTRRDDVITWTSGLAVDADGCPTAYAPRNSGLPALDVLANAGKPGNWWALVCDSEGVPVIQSGSDPAPGYYISTTSLVDRSRQRTDPRRYVDSSEVPYLSVPRELLGEGVHLGDVARVEYKGRTSAAVVADVGPRGKVGEGSMALARALGINDSPVRGGVESGVSVTLWVGSSKGWPRTVEDIATQVASL